MPVKSLNDIPTLTIESIKDIMGNIYTKRIKLPDKSPQLSRKYLDLEDGTYYSIYEICELIDKLVKNKKTIKLDNKEFKTTEELQKYLETETNNPYLSKSVLKEQYGYYIHENKIKQLLDNILIEPELLTEVETEKGRKEREAAQEMQERIEKVKKAYEEAIEGPTPPKTYFGLNKNQINKIVSISTAVLLTISSAYAFIEAYKHSKYPKNNNYEVTIEEYKRGIIENPDISNITVKDLCQELIVGNNYNINKTTLYEASDHNGIYDTIEGNYTIEKLAVQDENNIIHVLKDTQKGKKLSEVIPEQAYQTAKVISVGLSVPDGTIIGWIDVDKKAFKDIAKDIASKKSKITTNTYKVETNNPTQVINPNTGKTINIENGVLYDQNGNRIQDQQLVSVYLLESDKEILIPVSDINTRGGRSR